MGKKRKKQIKKQVQVDRTTERMRKDGYYESIDEREITMIKTMNLRGTYLKKIPLDVIKTELLKKAFMSKVYEYNNLLTIRQINEIEWLVKNYDVIMIINNNNKYKLDKWTCSNGNNQLILLASSKSYITLIAGNIHVRFLYKGKMSHMKFHHIKFYIGAKRELGWSIYYYLLKLYNLFWMNHGAKIRKLSRIMDIYDIINIFLIFVSINVLWHTFDKNDANQSNSYNG